MSSCCGVNNQTAMDNAQKRLLWIVLALNGVMFVVEFVAGWLAQSSGLLADSLDMLADTLVYAVSLYAVGKTLRHKANAATLNGVLQLLLALLVIVDVIKRWLLGSQPQVQMILIVALIALLVNVICFVLLYRFRRGDINIRASWICSRNDMLMNVGVIISAIAVNQTQQAWPDLVIALTIASIVVMSALRIIGDARRVHRGQQSDIGGCYG
ncbi:cation diffusion facilitator family transporter [Idiomarina xiamenensis]|uniref:Co/Zn/Cd efflux system protein n=1 Tax=Idiomarina xiamenensis 10-D-4 TaxID=740709 RepID=K2JWT0_9GAMM|nr:cation diffusion facilitator family transporter [Idiomarina xiamenensis]EKE79953.1 Co/Zn/Cd efflux system protein [Idiomarina xiamenensis 10-D-4]